MKWWMLSLIGSLAASVLGQPPRADPAAVSPAAAKELATYIVADATPGYVPEDVAVHVRKAVVLAALAARLDPDNARAWRVRAEALDVLGDSARAAEAEARHLSLTGGRGYESGTRWIRYSLATLDTAEQRITMLRALAEDTQQPKTLRALALVNQAAIAEGRGEIEEAASLYGQTLQLDPAQESALRALRRIEQDPSATRRVQLALYLLGGNPLAVNVAWEIGQICRDVGLYDQAVMMYDYARDVAVKTDQFPSEIFNRDRLDCLLDAGKYREALGEYSETIAAPVTADLPVVGMLVEASRALGDQTQMAVHVKRMHEGYRSYEAAARTEGDVAAEVAWFQLHYRHSARVAANWAAIGYTILPDDPFVQRVWAVTHLGSDQAAEARSLLENLRGDDLYALTALIDDAFARGDRAAGQRYLAEAASFGRRGPAWRQLRGVVQQHKVSLPDAPADRQPVADLIAEFVQTRALDMGRDPEEFLVVTVRPVAAEIGPGRLPAVTLTLTNVSDLPVPVGPWGLIESQVTLKVQMVMPREQDQMIQHTPVVWEAPRWLAAGESVTRIVTLDTGAVGQALAYRPLAPIELTIETVVDPVLRGEEWTSGVPSITVEPARILRKGLVDVESPEAYYEALKGLVRQFTGGDQVAAMRAAGVTVSLLALVEKVKAGQTGPAGKLGGDLREAELLSMLRYCLQSADPIVRARTLGAMRQLTPTPLMLQLAGPCLAQSSSLVRARAVEILAGAAEGPPNRALALLAEKDPDPLVRDMARTFMSKKEPTP
jgi:hypothetical protein